jgi:ribonuclease J
MVKLNFFGGVNEIGGNKILLEDRDARVFFDFGLSFAGEAKYFCGYLCARNVNGAGDYLEFSLLPSLPGLYAKEMIKNTKIKYEEPLFDALILSHAHIDHIGYLPFVHEEIPVYCGECTKTIIDAMQESGRIDLGEHNYRVFRTGKKIALGALEIEPIHVDHSIPGAYGFIINTSKGTIVYTGDLRLHGPASQMTNDFAEAAAEHKPIAMISEGTRVCPSEERIVFSSEAEVKKQCNEVVANAPNLVVSTFYSRDIDRLRTFYEVAKENDRKFVIPLRKAHLLSMLRNDPRLEIPDIQKDDTIVFYMKRKKTGEYLETDYYKWERPFLAKAVTYDYIRKNQSKVLLNLDLTEFTELVDIKPSNGGHFIHSMSEPFSEEDINKEVMHRWLNHFGLEFHQIHASGHCSQPHLKKIIDKIKPKQIIPVHTEHPEIFKQLFKNIEVIMPQNEKALTIN